nr:MAG: putative viral replication protein [Ulva CRESS virus 1]
MTDNYKYRNWLFTWNRDRDGLVCHKELTKYLKDNTELFVFQEENGVETGRDHYQGCFRLKYRQRKATVLKSFTKMFSPEKVKNLTVIRMSGSWEESYAYCTKSETAVPGTLSQSATLQEYSGRDIAFLGKEETHFPWQKKFADLLLIQGTTSFKNGDDRTILWIQDTMGNSGKSKWVKYLCFSNSSCCKVSFGTASQLRSSLISAGPHEAYLVDIPRTLGTDDSIESLLSALEDLKNGFLTSSFYGKSAKLLMDPPNVVCFSNQKPPLDKMTKDRWSLRIIDPVSKDWIDGETRTCV